MCNYVWTIFNYCYRSCIAYDIDPEAVEICQTNINDYDIDNVTTQVKDVREFDPGDAAVYDQVDTVIMNPPFGTKDNEGKGHFKL